MKISLAIALCLSLFTASVGLFAAHADATAVHVVSSGQKDLFVFKVSKSWHGAKVDVLDATGEPINSQRLLKRKMIINFCDLKAGTYKIKITKDHHTEEFQYIKK